MYPLEYLQNERIFNNGNLLSRSLCKIIDESRKIVQDGKTESYYSKFPVP
jgi:hypothetical protein